MIYYINNNYYYIFLILFIKSILKVYFEFIFINLLENLLKYQYLINLSNFIIFFFL